MRNSNPDDLDSLLDDFKSVKKNHYTNVTSLKLFRRVRNSQTPANFFKRIISPNILEEICRGSRQRYPIVAKTGKRENIQLDSSHYLKFAVAQLSEMVTFHKSQKELRDMFSGTSLSINKYNQIASYLHLSWETIWPMVNRNFETSIIPGGYATLDETIWIKHMICSLPPHSHFIPLNKGLTPHPQWTQGPHTTQACPYLPDCWDSKYDMMVVIHNLLILGNVCVTYHWNQRILLNKVDYLLVPCTLKNSTLALITS
ncbi:hypothetical protein PROFUN_11908 [Planoprotostelium fungivorum]|uniref:Uncharacterized protein n=1 Tax=Planoprotostelium fungivorum TaxID=1890364 RepID=A0A2P6N927_9EUKA|nr:hypothetical protein PROFUN_11908 [Planoprotostelium fungivorum]